MANDKLQSFSPPEESGPNKPPPAPGAAARCRLTLQVPNNGKDAISYLSRKGNSQTRPQDCDSRKTASRKPASFRIEAKRPTANQPIKRFVTGWHFDALVIQPPLA
jgi:hypothetical protein